MNPKYMAGKKIKRPFLNCCLGMKVVIVGVGGVGKTTLARLVYNDVKMNRCFDLKAWVYVSKEFDVVRIIKAIFLAVTLETVKYEYLDDFASLHSLQKSLTNQLSGKKFLLVLDDVWKESCDEWYALHRCFMAGAVGSKIVVTTRDESIVSTMGTISPYYLNKLPFDDCLSLFTHHALGIDFFDGLSNLEVIGEELVRRCKGLPLAVKTLGGLLRGKLNCDDWEDILNSEIWDLSAERSGIVPILRLSYHQLPPYLKRCFAYCAIFPKGYEFDKDELVLLWMAEGFLQEPEEKKHMEDLGHEYFLELLARPFFQQSSNNKSCFVMHDLINDLAKSVAGEICFNLEGDTLNKSFEKIRHSSFDPHPFDVSQRFEVFYRMKGLRTFLALPVLVSSYDRPFLSNKVLHDLLPKLRYLRALSLTDYEIRELPDSVGDLKHLRYLNLSYSTIKKLPESMSALLNLQTLILRGCRELTMLPESMSALLNLQTLILRGCRELTMLPAGIGNLTCLKKFVVKWCPQLVSLAGEEGGLLPCKLEELEFEDCDKLEKLPNGLHSLTCLRSLSIKRCPKLVSFPATGVPYTLKRLELYHCKALESLHDGMTIHGGNSNQCFLEELVISECPSLKSFPRGMLPTTLKKLEISYCKNLESLPEGMMVDDNNSNNTSHLKSLEISNCNQLRGCDALEYFPERGFSIPNLKSLEIGHCYNLKSFPEGGLPPNLTSLEIRYCLKLKQAMSEWGLYRLSSLRQLTLGNTCPTDSEVSFPDDDCSMLPKTLTHICIEDLENLESISRGIKNLTSLENLEIRDCPNLHSLPKEGLPASLGYLEIWDCPVLEEGYLKEKGEYWPIISHIPCVRIDEEIQ